MTRELLTPKAEATRSKLLETGYGLAVRNGFSAIGIQDVLREAGVPKGSFYHYFPSKEAFGAAVLDQYVADYAHRLTQPLSAPGTVRERLMRFFNAWMTDPDDASVPGWAQRCLVVKLSAEVADLSETMRQVLATGVERLVRRAADLITAGRADGSLPAGADASALAQALYQMWVGAALLSKLMQTQEPMARALSATEQLLACAAGTQHERTNA